RLVRVRGGITLRTAEVNTIVLAGTVVRAALARAWWFRIFGRRNLGRRARLHLREPHTRHEDQYERQAVHEYYFTAGGTTDGCPTLALVARTSIRRQGLHSFPGGRLSRRTSAAGAEVLSPARECRESRICDASPEGTAEKSRFRARTRIMRRVPCRNDN